MKEFNPTKEKKKRNFKVTVWLKKKVIRIICVTDEILDKASRPLMYLLEIIGVIVVIYLMWHYIRSIRMIEKGQVEQGTQIVNALSTSLKSMKELLVGLFVALPAAIGTLKALNKKWKPAEQNSQNSEARVAESATEPVDVPEGPQS